MANDAAKPDPYDPTGPAYQAGIELGQKIIAAEMAKRQREAELWDDAYRELEEMRKEVLGDD